MAGYIRTCNQAADALHVLERVGRVQHLSLLCSLGLLVEPGKEVPFNPCTLLDKRLGTSQSSPTTPHTFLPLDFSCTSFCRAKQTRTPRRCSLPSLRRQIQTLERETGRARCQLRDAASSAQMTNSHRPQHKGWVDVVVRKACLNADLLARVEIRCALSQWRVANGGGGEQDGFALVAGQCVRSATLAYGIRLVEG
jgi:hypothetical protein